MVSAVGFFFFFFFFCDFYEIFPICGEGKGL
jgi:hypothetical protein